MSRECNICEHHCRLQEGRTGWCRMYENRDGQIRERFPDQFLVMVPAEIEVVPLLHFRPASKVLQVCTIGCNFHCPGCVSWVLTESPEAIRGATRMVGAEKVVATALKEGCSAIMFCFNEPAVSFPTFKRLAILARRQGLLVGCASNGYFTEKAFLELLDHIDCINIGIKGCSDATYRKMGANSVEPVFRNLRLAHDSGVALEVAGVYVKGREEEVFETARRLALVSRDIPFQVMRFMPLAGADTEGEPSIREAETLCRTLEQVLSYVYLFNSPGTTLLDTRCPVCGRLLIQRGFNGPMCAHVAEFFYKKTSCSCGQEIPVVRGDAPSNDVQVLGFYGGYKTISSLDGILNTLAFLGEKRPEVISTILHRILESDFLKDLYCRTKTVKGYLETIGSYGELAGRQDEASRLQAFIGDWVATVKKQLGGVERPSVYFALGHPLLAVFGDKMECNLVEIAGGHCLNSEIQRDGRPGLRISAQLLRRLNPDILLTSEAMGYPLADFLDFCREHLTDVSAVRNGRIYSLRPYSVAGRPDWILGLLRMAILFHPERCDYDLLEIAGDFYHTFPGTVPVGLGSTCEKVME